MIKNSSKQLKIMETTTAKQALLRNDKELSSLKANLKQGYLLNKDALVPVPPEYISSNAPDEKRFRSAKELEELVFKNSKTLFGQQTILVNMPEKGNGIFRGKFPPVGFLFDSADPAKPKLYIIDILSSMQYFYGFIFPRITQLFKVLKSQQAMEGLFDLISKDKAAQKVLLGVIKQSDILSFLKTAVFGKCFILLVTDGEVKELTETIDMYSATWQDVKPVLIQRYVGNGNTFCTMHPPFTEINRSNPKERKKRETVLYTEEHHLGNASEIVKEIYNKVKTELLKVNKQLQFNPQKYYISLRKDKNLAFFHFSQKKISLVVMNSEKETRKVIKHHDVKTLTEKVQKFWNGSSCTIAIENDKHLNEVIALLKKMITA